MANLQVWANPLRLLSDRGCRPPVALLCCVRVLRPAGIVLVLWLACGDNNGRPLSRLDVQSLIVGQTCT